MYGTDPKVTVRYKNFYLPFKQNCFDAKKQLHFITLLIFITLYRPFFRAGFIFLVVKWGTSTAVLDTTLYTAPRGIRTK